MMGVDDEDFDIMWNISLFSSIFREHHTNHDVRKDFDGGTMIRDSRYYELYDVRKDIERLLMSAASEGDKHMIEWLIGTHGEGIIVRDEDGILPSYLADQGGHHALAQWLESIEDRVDYQINTGLMPRWGQVYKDGNRVWIYDYATGEWETNE